MGDPTGGPVTRLSEPNGFASRLPHVYWIGGGSGAGKSTVARRLVADYGLQLYSCDDTIIPHLARSNAIDHPLLHSFLAMNMDERWVDRSPTEMLETFHGFQGEGFELILEDLLALPAEPPVLVEGFKLLPRLVAPLSRPGHAVWLNPTPEFRNVAFTARGSTWDIAGRTSQPERALANLLVRDRLFSQGVLNEARALRLPVIEVTTELTVEELTRRVADTFGWASGPSRGDLGEAGGGHPE